ncbi:MAG: ribbon-helix-helix domain-containing protein [Methanobrevibacter sp.]|jgi:hypothetical protein|nr:ribbon-helix-helix domain-containing protein [Candidatus Methanovirga aequatorialis]
MQTKMDNRITIQLTEIEKNILDNKVKESGINKSKIIRELIRQSETPEEHIRRIALNTQRVMEHKEDDSIEKLSGSIKTNKSSDSVEIIKKMRENPYWK